MVTAYGACFYNELGVDNHRKHTQLYNLV
jgi:hypothetical protein